jgi:hypothetical protein
MKYEFLLKALVASGLVAASAQLACSAESSDPYPGGSGARPNNTGGTATAGGAGGTGATAGTVGSGATAGTVGSGGTPPATGGTPGTGGTPATGGSAGAAAGGASGGTGGGACAPVTGSATDLLISDLEAGTNAVNAPRTGYWFSFVQGGATNAMPPPDPTGAVPFAPTASGNGGSMYYAHFTCTGGTYVGIGFDLNNCAGKPNPYNVSAYTGVSFAYKSSHDFKVMVSSMATTLPANGGTCAGGESVCNNHHATVITAAAAWTTIQVPFSMLLQDYGTIAALDKTNVLQIQFQVAGVWDNDAQVTNMITPAAVDLSIDDVSFY